MDDFHPQSSLLSEVFSRISDPIQSITPLSNSSFTRNFAVQCTTNRYFVKLSEKHDCLDAEADGLEALSNTDSIRVPNPIVKDRLGSTGLLAVEFLDLQNSRPDYPRLAHDLARLHRTQGEAYGWHRNNYLGASEQANSFDSDWAQFFRDNRLGYQFQLARENGYGAKLATLESSVLDAVVTILNQHEPEPSIIHGDLWRGNCGFIADGVPVIFDPAVYFGDREADLAMMRLFGGFPESFYDAYQREWPLHSGWQLRQTVYNLYHILNHLNLFGRSYLQQAESMCKQLLAEAN